MKRASLYVVSILLISATVRAGLSDLIDRFVLALSAVSEIPARVLMGQQKAGLNNEGEGETRDWYDRLSDDQETILRPIVERLVYLTMISMDGPTGGQVIDNWHVEFYPLWQMTEKESSEIRKTTAETDKLYIETGVLQPEEVAESRFGGGEYSTETNLYYDRGVPQADVPQQT